MKIKFSSHKNKFLYTFLLINFLSLLGCLIITGIMVDSDEIYAQNKDRLLYYQIILLLTSIISSIIIPWIN